MSQKCEKKKFVFFFLGVKKKVEPPMELGPSLPSQSQGLTFNSLFYFNLKGSNDINDVSLIAMQNNTKCYVLSYQTQVKQWHECINIQRMEKNIIESVFNRYGYLNWVHMQINFVLSFFFSFFCLFFLFKTHKNTHTHAHTRIQTPKHTNTNTISKH